jgi:3-dehydroquinate dehydratase-2
MTSKKNAKKPDKKKRTKQGPREIHVLNGPNLNMLGYREPEIYGSDTIFDLEDKLKTAAKDADKNVKLHFFQTNHEGDMIDYVQALALTVANEGRLAGVILNPGGWTHTSVALRDAVIMLRPAPLVEVHLTNLLEREEFRHFSFFEDIADYRVVGLGQDGYLEAFRWLIAESQKERLDVH